jgi:hypothetical protein
MAARLRDLFSRTIGARARAESMASDIVTSWYEIVDQYLPRNVTFLKDTFPAISAVAKEVHQASKFTYKAGIWKEDAHKGLMWVTHAPTKRCPEYIAPSWSWACLITRKVDKKAKTPWLDKKIAKILDIRSTVVGEDPYGQVTSASLTLRGPWRNLERDDDDRNQDKRESDDNVQIRFQSHLISGKTKYFFDVVGEQVTGSVGCIVIAECQTLQDSFMYTMYDKCWCALLLKKIVGPGDDGHDHYQRIGIIYIDKPNKKNWTERTVTII